MLPDYLDNLLEKRQSIRKYKEDIPPEDWINQMIYCANCAPSPSNIQPVRFVRLKSKAIKNKLFDQMAQTKENYIKLLRKKTNGEETKPLRSPKKLINRIRYYWRFSDFMFNSPVIFAAGTVMDNTSGLIPYLTEAGLLTHNNYKEIELNISLGLALKGFILKGEAYGLGTCILSAPMAFIPDINEIIKIDNINIKCFITVGFPDETPLKTSRKNPLELIREL